MSLGDFIKELNDLGEEINKLSNKYQYLVNDEKDDAYTEERFVYGMLEAIKPNLDDVKEMIGYLNKNIFAEGKLESKHGKFYVSDYQLKSEDCVELLIDQEWIKTDICLVKGEYYIDLMDKTMSDIIFARVRK